MSDVKNINNKIETIFETVFFNVLGFRLGTDIQVYSNLDILFSGLLFN
jgi:hypothetical protein